MLPSLAAQKIRAEHLDRPAVIYVRQSTAFQVRESTASSARQYDLSRRGRDLGWPEQSIRVIDQDQGLSGASAADREGFRQLITLVGLGQAGLSSAWRRRGWRAPAAIGTACSRSAP